MNTTESEKTWRLGAGPTRLRVCGMTDTGLVRARNEDAFVAMDLGSGQKVAAAAERLDAGERGVLLAVADGMGGHADGDVASALAIDALVRTMTEASDLRAGPELLARAIDHAHHCLCSVAGTARGEKRMGTTLTALHVRGGEAHIAHVGDSRAYLVRDGLIHRLTRDQSYAELLVDLGVYTRDEADRSRMRHSLLQALGQLQRLEVALSTIALRRRDCLLLCSDGLTSALDDTEIARAILGAPAEVACRKLVDLANLRGDDNVAVVLATVSGGVPAVPPGETIDETHRILPTYVAPVDA